MTTNGRRAFVSANELGLVRLRLPMTRRAFAKGAVVAGVAASVGLPSLSASAATEVNYLGWQGYDDGMNVDDWFDKNGIVRKMLNGPDTWLEHEERFPRLFK